MSEVMNNLRPIAAEPGDDGPERRHIPSLDGLRGIAILLVLAVHLFSEDVAGNRALNWAYRQCRSGWIGVDLFFVLSGYLITGILLDSRGQPGYFRSFFARRALRTFPLYFGLVSVGAVVAAASNRFGDQIAPGCVAADNFRHAQAWLWTYTSNLLAARRGRFVPFNVGVLGYGQFWSLAIEEQFYTFWAVVVLACPRQWLARVALGIATAAALTRAAYVYRASWGDVAALTAYVWTPFRVDGLLVGAAAVMLTRSPAASALIRRLVWPILVCTAGALLGVHRFIGWSIANRVVAAGGYTLLAYGFAAIVICCVVADPRHPVRRVTEQRWLRLLGKYSYGIYATHLIVIAIIVGPVTAGLLPIVRSSAAADLAARLLAAVVAVAVAAFSWHVFELPFIRLKRLFPNSPIPKMAGDATPKP